MSLEQLQELQSRLLFWQHSRDVGVTRHSDAQTLQCERVITEIEQEIANLKDKTPCTTSTRNTPLADPS